LAHIPPIPGRHAITVALLGSPGNSKSRIACAVATEAADWPCRGAPPVPTWRRSPPRQALARAAEPDRRGDAHLGPHLQERRTELISGRLPLVSVCRERWWGPGQLGL